MSQEVMDSLGILGIALGFLVASSIAWTDEGKPLRAWFVKMCLPKTAETVVQKAVREREERLGQYTIEYLSYGFTERQAAEKAEIRMQAEAASAEKVTE